MSLLLLTKSKLILFCAPKKTIHNDLNITNNDDIQSCKTPRKQSYSISTTLTPKHHMQHISAVSVRSFNVHTTEKLPPGPKEYMCFHLDGEYIQTAGYVKLRVRTKVIVCELSINTFEQKCVLPKVMLQSPHLKHHIKNIGIDQSLINSFFF